MAADRGVPEHPLSDLAERLAQARRVGDPAPEELERLVELLAKSDIDPGDRLTRALEGFARWSEERRASQPAPYADDHARRERAPVWTGRQEDYVPQKEPRRSEPRHAPASNPISNELESRLEDFARSLQDDRADEPREPARRAAPRSEEPRRAEPRPAAREPEPRPQSKPAVATPPIASLRAALAEISARQKALDAESEAATLTPRSQAPLRQDAPVRQQTAPRPEEPARHQAEPAYATAARATDSYAASPNVTSAPAWPEPAPPEAMRELRAELERLARSMTDLPTRAEIDRMTREMSDLAERLTEDRPARLDQASLSAIDSLVAEVDRMRTDAPSPQTIAHLVEEVHAIAARLEVIGPRNSTAIDQLARRIDDVRSELDHFPRIAAVDGVAREIQTLIARLDAQEAVAAPTREAVVGLAGRVHALDGQIAAMAEATATRDEALQRINATIRTELESLPRADAVTDLGRQIDALTEGLKSRSAIGPALKAVEGLAGKVDALDGKIAAIATRREEEASWFSDAMRDEIAAVARPEAFDGLSRQIELLTERLASDRSPAATAGMVGLSRQIEELTDRLASERREPATIGVDVLTSQIKGLGERLDTMTAATDARGAAFERVEGSIRAIAEQLITARSPGAAASGALEAEVVRLVEGMERNGDRVEDLHDAFAGLAARIERSCADLGAHAVESAVAAARDVMSARTGDGRLESELASTLSELRSSSTQSERRAADALDGVRSTLERLLDRMEYPTAPQAFFGEPAEPVRRSFGREPEPEIADATEIARAAARRAMAEIADTPQPSRRVPHVDEASAFRTYGEFGPDHPIEPGAGLPRADGETVSPAPPSAAALIASARRAQLQGEGDPASVSKTADAGSDRPSLFSEVLATLKKRKRPILFGVAAMLIVFTALYVASGMTGEPEQVPPPPPAPQSRLAPAQEPKVGADTAAKAAETSLASADREAPAEEDVAAADDEPEASPDPRAEQPAPAPRRSASNASPSPDAQSATPLAGAPRAPARDLTDFAFADSTTATPRSRADWKTAEPDTTGSISRDPNALPDQIGGQTLKSRAKAGDAAAELEVGDRLLDGRGVPADPAAAARWFEKAAAQGLAPAQHRLGSLYEKGRGVPRDVAAARRWYEQAAASGNVRAMHNLGVVHAEGGLGKPDYNAAMVWFRMAAERGLTDSGYNLAVLEARGLGGKRDLVEAYKWFALAAADGDEDASKKRDEVGKALGQSITIAKAAVESFTPKPIDPAANEPQAPTGGWDRVANRANNVGAGPVTR